MGMNNTTVNLKTTTLLIWGFILTLLVIVLFSGFALYEARELAQAANKMYNHPLAVSNALRDIKININAIHRSMKDVVLAKTPEQINSSLEKVNKYEQESFECFALVQERFLGDENYVLSVLKDFEDWKTIRNEVIKLTKKGKLDDAIAITTGKGLKHIDMINSGADGKTGLNYLMNYANDKAEEFQNNAKLREKRAIIQIIIILVSAIISTFFVMLLLSQSLKTARRLEKSEERLKLSQKLANIGSWDRNIVKNRIRWSETVKHIFGFAENAAPEFYDVFLQIIHPEDRDLVINSVNSCIEQKKDYEIEYRITTAKGTMRWVYETGNVLFNKKGKPIRMLGMVRDITERKITEMKSIKHLAEVERSNEDLNDFAAIVSHDLREPLMTIAAFLQLINKKYGDKLDKKGMDYLLRSINSAKRLHEMIDDLLSYARIATERKTFSVCNANDILNNAVENLYTKIKESDARITYETLPHIIADKLQIERIFQNLIGNSLKFCDNKEPLIHVAWKEQDGYHEFSVKDNGIGIEQQYHERIFNIFTRLHGREDYDGSGIGLAACGKIIERHGGRIWLESGPGKGTIFYFTLPINQSI
jgi:PAS domain S-box-containing protein